MGRALSANVVIDVALSGTLLEVPAEISVNDPFDMALDSVPELFVTFGNEMEANGMCAKTAGFSTAEDVKNEARLAAEDIGGPVFFCPLELKDSDEAIFSLVCGRFAPNVGTVDALTALALRGRFEEYRAHMAEKAPEARRSRLAPPTEAWVEGEATVEFTDWIAVVTRKLLPIGKSQNSVDMDASDAPTCSRSKR